MSLIKVLVVLLKSLTVLQKRYTKFFLIFNYLNQKIYTFLIKFIAFFFNFLFYLLSIVTKSMLAINERGGGHG